MFPNKNNSNPEPTIIYDIGVSHGGSVERLYDTAKAIHKADPPAYIKMQYFTPELATPNAIFANGKKMQPILEKFYIDWSTMIQTAIKLHQEGIKLGITVFTALQSLELVELNDQLKFLSFYKVASPSCEDEDLVSVYTSDTPLIVSLGGTHPKNWIDIIDKYDDNTVFMYCVSKYPTPPIDVSIKNLSYLQSIAGHNRVGFSSHLEPNCIPNSVANVGVRIFEFHAQLDDTIEHPDQGICVLPDNMQHLRESIKQSLYHEPTDLASIKYTKRYWVLNKHVAAGTVLNFDIIEQKRCLMPPANFTKDSLKNAVPLDIDLSTGYVVPGEMYPWIPILDSQINLVASEYGIEEDEDTSENIKKMLIERKMCPADWCAERVCSYGKCASEAGNPDKSSCVTDLLCSHGFVGSSSRLDACEGCEFKAYRKKKGNNG